MKNETILNKYFNIGKYNDPNKIGYVMDLIRKQKPNSLSAWESWYFSNVCSYYYFVICGQKMADAIPTEAGITAQECTEYMVDVVCRRTYNGYCNEMKVLRSLHTRISTAIYPSPRQWDTDYFIDFYAISEDGTIIGIQLKPVSFYKGDYQKAVDIERKLENFRNKYDAKTIVLQYEKNKDGKLEIVNPSACYQLKNWLSV